MSLFKVSTVSALVMVAVMYVNNAAPASIQTIAVSRPATPSGALFSQPPVMIVQIDHHTASQIPAT